jgi:hypothetical protein
MQFGEGLMMAKDALEIIDSTGLTDADWAEINKLQKLYAEQGADALNTSLADLRERDFICYVHIVGAFFPNEFREAIKDEMANAGMDEDDLRALIRKLESPARDQ